MNEDSYHRLCLRISSLRTKIKKSEKAVENCRNILSKLTLQKDYEDVMSGKIIYVIEVEVNKKKNIYRNTVFGMVTVTDLERTIELLKYWKPKKVRISIGGGPLKKSITYEEAITSLQLEVV